MGAIEEVRALLKVDARFYKADARFDKLERDSEKRHNEWVSYLSLEAGMNKVERAPGTSGKQGQ